MSGKRDIEVERCQERGLSGKRDVRKVRRTLERFMAKEEINAVPDDVRGAYLYGLQSTGL